MLRNAWWREWEDVDGSVLAAIRMRTAPGASLREISRMTGLSSVCLAWSIGRLEAARLITTYVHEPTAGVPRKHLRFITGRRP